MIIKRPINKIKVVLLGSTPLCIFAYKILLKSQQCTNCEISYSKSQTKMHFGKMILFFTKSKKNKI